MLALKISVVAVILGLCFGNEDAFNYLDLNGNEVLEQHELFRMIDKADSNSDYAISREEFINYGGTEELFVKADTDSSGGISAGEAMAAYKAIDANHDALIGLDEFMAIYN